MIQESPLPVERFRRTSCPAWGICSKRPHILGRSHTRSPSAGQLYKAEKVMTPGENARTPLVPNTHIFRTRVSTLEDSPLCAVNAGKHSGTNPYLPYTRDTILEKHTSLVNV